MRDRGQNVLRAVTLVLLICLANLLVFAGVPTVKSPTNAGLVTTGILSVFDQDSASVNGNIALDGTTILSGSEIKTDKNGARINLKGLGSVDLAAGTSVSLTFTSGQINLNVSIGQAQLTSLKGVTGVLTTPAGDVLKTDPALDTSTVGNNAETVSAEGTKKTGDKDYWDKNSDQCIDADKNGKLECGAKPWALWSTGAKVGLIVGIAAAVAIPVAIVVYNNRTVSPVR